MALVVQCAQCKEVVGHSKLRRSILQKRLGESFRADAFRLISLSREKYKEEGAPATAILCKAFCASCKGPVGKFRVDLETLYVTKGEVQTYEIPELAHPGQASTYSSSSSASQPCSAAAPQDLKQQNLDVAQIQAIVAQQIQIAGTNALKGSVVDEDRLRAIVKRMINEELGTVKFTVLALNNRVNKLVENLTFDESQEESNERCSNQEEDGEEDDLVEKQKRKNRGEELSEIFQPMKQRKKVL